MRPEQASAGDVRHRCENSRFSEPLDLCLSLAGHDDVNNNSKSSNSPSGIPNGWRARMSQGLLAQRGTSVRRCRSVCEFISPIDTKLTFADPKPQGIFGVPLRQSIVYANVAISLVDDTGKSYIYGYVPIVVAKCGVFLKEKGTCTVPLSSLRLQPRCGWLLLADVAMCAATTVEGIFRLNGSEKRIKELKHIFDSPDRYGKGLSWDGYTVHDAANVLRRYLNDLPEPVVPLDLYEQFREPLRGATKNAVGDAEGPQFLDDFDVDAAIVRYQQLIKDLPPLNRQLLLYILDLLAVFAAKAEENRMNSQNLAAIFQPGMLSHPMHAMAPEEYRLNQCVLIFLIENQDHFLIGMQGTAADEKMVQEVQKGTPTIVAPATPSPSRKSGVHRSASNASAGAESVSREGKVRRNKSTSSRHSRHSNGAPSPGSPAMPTTPSSGLGRSNTVPSRRSPALPGGRFGHVRNETMGQPPSPLTPVVTSTANIPAPPTVEEVATPDMNERRDPIAESAGHLTPAHAAERSQERLLEQKAAAAEAVTPSKERSLHSLFQRSPTDNSEKKQPNKLRKKRIPSSTTPSAASSTTSLPYSAGVSPNTETPNPMDQIGEFPGKESEQASQDPKPEAVETPSESTPRASQMPSTGNLQNQTSEHALREQTSHPTSLHTSSHGESETDRLDERLASPEQPDKEKKRRWRLSRKKEESSSEAGDTTPVTSPRRIGFNKTAELSNSSVGGESSTDPNLELHSSLESGFRDHRESRDESRGISGWIRNKVREAKETRTKSPPGDHSSLSSILPVRGKSVDIKRSTEEEKDREVSAAPKTQETGSSQ